MIDPQTIWPVNGYLLVEIEDLDDGPISRPSAPKYLRGRVIRASGQYVRIPRKGIYRTREPDVREGDRILFPAVYADGLVRSMMYMYIDQRHILLKTDAVLLVEEELGGLDGVDLYY